MSQRPKRWFWPPPQATAYFSKRRQPGVVLRVSRIFALVPLIASTKRDVRVATPERRWTKFRATRSAVSRAGAGPQILSKAVRAETRWPSFEARLIRTLDESSRKAVSAKANPARTSGSRARITAEAVALLGTNARV